MFENIDLIVAGIMLIIVVAVTIASKVSTLPSKALPYVIASAFTAVGIIIWKNTRTKGLRKEIEKREEELKKKDALLKQLKEDYQVQEEKFKTDTREQDKKLKALMRELAKLKAATAEEVAAIDDMSWEELEQLNSANFGN